MRAGESDDVNDVDDALRRRGCAANTVAGGRSQGVEVAGVVEPCPARVLDTVLVSHECASRNGFERHGPGLREGV